MTGAKQAEYLVRLPAARGDLVAGHLGRTPARRMGPWAALDSPC